MSPFAGGKAPLPPIGKQIDQASGLLTMENVRKWFGRLPVRRSLRLKTMLFRCFLGFERLNLHKNCSKFFPGRRFGVIKERSSFLKKRSKRLLFLRRSPCLGSWPCIWAQTQEQKSFASFLQKRSAFFLFWGRNGTRPALAPHRPSAMRATGRVWDCCGYGAQFRRGWCIEARRGGRRCGARRIRCGGGGRVGRR